jgi:hypothetical protein
MTVKGPTPQGGYWYARALMESDLPPMAALLGHVLAATANSTTGVVEVSLTQLARRSHMARSSVMKHLNMLQARGFVVRRRPSNWAAIQRHEVTTYTCTIPAGYSTGARPSHDLAPVDKRAKARPPHNLGLGRERAKARPPHGHSSIELKGAAPDADAPGPPPAKCPHGHVIARGTCPEPECVEAYERGAAP